MLPWLLPERAWWRAGVSLFELRVSKTNSQVNQRFGTKDDLLTLLNELRNENVAIMGSQFSSSVIGRFYLLKSGDIVINHMGRTFEDLTKGSH